MARMAANDPGQDPYGVEDARLTSLDKRLKQAHHDEAIRTGRASADTGKGYSQGNRVLAALIGSLAGSALIGWLLDRWFGTSPWLLFVLIFLGIGVAFKTIIGISNERPE
jgi:ATP synthase protein I